jgi:hypothetical protein
MIYTFSREAVELGIGRDFPELAEPYALISISTPKVYGSRTPTVDRFDEWGEPAYLNGADNHTVTLPFDMNRVDLLRLAFWDLDEISPKWSLRLQAQARLYSSEDARRVAAFVEANQRMNLVIHCDAGISRSQGMAIAIADYTGALVQHSVMGYPNRLVQRLTWTALCMRSDSNRFRQDEFGENEILVKALRAGSLTLFERREE